MAEKTSDAEKARLDRFIELDEAGRIPEYGQTLWWLSFASDDGFLGACIVPGSDVATAAMAAHALGINPGGEVLGIPTPPDCIDRLPKAFLGRLLSLEECREFDRIMAGP